MGLTGFTVHESPGLISGCFVLWLQLQPVLLIPSLWDVLIWHRRCPGLAPGRGSTAAPELLQLQPGLGPQGLSPGGENRRNRDSWKCSWPGESPEQTHLQVAVAVSVPQQGQPAAVGPKARPSSCRYSLEHQGLFMRLCWST